MPRQASGSLRVVYRDSKTGRFVSRRSAAARTKRPVYSEVYAKNTRLGRRKGYVKTAVSLALKLQRAKAPPDPVELLAQRIADEFSINLSSDLSMKMGTDPEGGREEKALIFLGEAPPVIVDPKEVKAAIREAKRNPNQTISFQFYLDFGEPRTDRGQIPYEVKKVFKRIRLGQKSSSIEIARFIAFEQLKFTTPKLQTYYVKLKYRNSEGKILHRNIRSRFVM